MNEDPKYHYEYIFLNHKILQDLNVFKIHFFTVFLYIYYYNSTNNQVTVHLKMIEYSNLFEIYDSDKKHFLFYLFTGIFPQNFKFFWFLKIINFYNIVDHLDIFFNNFTNSQNHHYSIHNATNIYLHHFLNKNYHILVFVKI